MSSGARLANARVEGTPCANPGHGSLLAGYELGRAFDEMFVAGGGRPAPRQHYAALHDRLAQTSPDDFRRRSCVPWPRRRSRRVMRCEESGSIADPNSRVWPATPSAERAAGWGPI